jgi:serine/threonine protein kinase
MIEIDADSPAPFLVMDYIEGQDLSKQVTESGPLRGAMLSVTFLALVEALQDIHAAGIVHRDLKPSNIIIGSDGIRVVDFGISALQEVAGLTSTGMMVGTAAWMSPEQVEGRPVDSASDVFNLGLVMAFLCRGKHAFGEGRPDALMYRIVHAEPDLTMVPPSLLPIIKKCLTKDAASRPSLTEINAALQGSSSSGEPVSSSGTIVLGEGILRRQIDNDLVEKRNSEQQFSLGSYLDSPVSKGWWSRKKFVGVDAFLGIVMLIVAVTSVGGFSRTTTTSEVTLPPIPSTTTEPITPRFELRRSKGKSTRWDPCAGPINVAVNFGQLKSSQIDHVTKAVIQTINEVSDISGLTLTYSGSTGRIPSLAKFRDGRNGSEAMLIAFLPEGKGMSKVGENYVHRISLSNGAGSATWLEIVAYDGQIPNHLDGGTFEQYLLAVRRIVLAMVGLIGVVSDHEIMGTDADGFMAGNQTDYGPGDILGLKAVGKNQGCIK